MGSVPWKFSSHLHCADCDIAYSEPTPAMFSFNSPLGACDTCRGFGRVIGVDFGLVVPNESLTLQGRLHQAVAVPELQGMPGRPGEVREEARIPLDIPFKELSEQHKDWVLEGEPEWVSWRKSWPGIWYGVRRFFKWLESKAYKMHIRVLLSKYRAYTPCATCHGTRLKPDAMLWKVNGRSIHDLMLLPLDRVKRFFREDIDASRTGHGSAAHGDPHAAELPLRRRPRLPDARPPVAHALGRRSAAHQPHHRARHLAGQHAVRARRAVDRPAPARHGPRHRRDEAPARRRQLAGGGRARPADHVRRRPHPRHRPGAGRARRRDRVLRFAGSIEKRKHDHGRIPFRAQEGRADDADTPSKPESS